MSEILLDITLSERGTICNFFASYPKIMLAISTAHDCQTLFGNPKGPVELGNPNTCAETKLCLNLYFIPAQEVVCYEPDGFIQLV